MKVQLKDTIVGNKNCSMGEGVVIALGDSLAVVRVTKAGIEKKVDELYDIPLSWISPTDIYNVKGDFYEVGKTYRYKPEAWDNSITTYYVKDVIVLDNPSDNTDPRVAVGIGTDSSGAQFVELFVKNELKYMEEKV